MGNLTCREPLSDKLPSSQVFIQIEFLYDKKLITLILPQ